jgi:periplasmic protein CpxP/Spy
MTHGIRFRKFIAASLLLLGAGGVMASRLSAHDFSRGGRGHGLGPLGRMARHLDLTDEQKTRIRDLMESHKPQLEAQREARRAAHRALADAVAAEPRDEAAIRARAAEIGRVAGDSAVLKARIRSEISPLLTDQQREKLREMKERFQERKGRRGGRS